MSIRSKALHVMIHDRSWHMPAPNPPAPATLEEFTAWLDAHGEQINKDFDRSLHRLDQVYLKALAFFAREQRFKKIARRQYRAASRRKSRGLA